MFSVWSWVSGTYVTVLSLSPTVADVPPSQSSRLSKGCLPWTPFSLASPMGPPGEQLGVDPSHLALSLSLYVVHVSISSICTFAVGMGRASGCGACPSLPFIFSVSLSVPGNNFNVVYFPLSISQRCTSFLMCFEDNAVVNKQTCAEVVRVLYAP